MLKTDVSMHDFTTWAQEHFENPTSLCLILDELMQSVKVSFGQTFPYFKEEKGHPDCYQQNIQKQRICDGIAVCWVTVLGTTYAAMVLYSVTFRLKRVCNSLHSVFTDVLSQISEKFHISSYH